MSYRGRVLVIEETPRAETRRLWEGIRADGWDVRALPLARSLEHDAVHPDVVVLNFAGTEGDDDRDRYLDAALRMAAERGPRRPPVVAVDETLRPDARPAGIADVLRAPWSVGHVSARLGSLARLATMRAEMRRRLETAARFGLSRAEPDTGASLLDAHVLVVGAGIRYFTIERALAKRSTLIGAFTIDTAVDYLERRPFDAVVVNLPLEDAIDFLEILRRNPDTHALPAVVLTGEADPRLIEATRDAGATDLVFAEEGEALFAERVEQAMTEHRLRLALKAAYGDTRHDETLDSVTGLYRRAFLMEHLGALIDDARAGDAPLAVIGFRIAELAEINAEWGWAAGDRLLAQVGRLIARLIRGEDLAARAGGDRLALLLPDTDTESARPVAHRIAGILETTAFSLPGATGPMWVTIDVGVVEFDGVEDETALLARAFG
ncbi:diguanylate cyclase domain-containing protein [Pinisolibacter aquiterrae]|uniref:diguanylate cyclase domain-containing protein n=1 Tax=Pinisolibacter aquiterrae TaxID=2815579 RepID=UPI001C3D34AD|nr:diguanylate cyclase [Pinisolibacter aquiterrae]MBV5265957.1 diguanylate cyclase [Pinisolibacter aquiterrae]MCC8237185.1 diguanylate cyclase [Pinisolibacter aquiterrae]